MLIDRPPAPTGHEGEYDPAFDANFGDCLARFLDGKGDCNTRKGDQCTRLWYGKDAEAAARFYVSLVPGSSLTHLMRSPADWPGGVAGEVIPGSPWSAPTRQR